jgi:hypothetical protein
MVGDKQKGNMVNFHTEFSYLRKTFSIVIYGKISVFRVFRERAIDLYQTSFLFRENGKTTEMSAMRKKAYRKGVNLFSMPPVWKINREMQNLQRKFLSVSL